MNDRVAQVVAILKQSKAKGLKYFAATEALRQQGFTQSEIDQASDQFAYNVESAADKKAEVDQAFAEENEAYDEMEREVREENIANNIF